MQFQLMTPTFHNIGAEELKLHPKLFFHLQQNNGFLGDVI